MHTLHFNRDSKPVQLKKEVLDFSMFDPKPSYDKSSTSNWLKGFILKLKLLLFLLFPWYAHWFLFEMNGKDYIGIVLLPFLAQIPTSINISS